MDSKIDAILTRILDGNASAEERRIFTEWLQADETHIKDFQKSEAIWNAIEIIKNTDQYDPEKAYRDFLVRAGKLTPQTKHKKNISYWIWNNYYSRVAAIFIGILILALSAYYVTGVPQNQKQISYFEATTPIGSKTQLVLTDGTKIWLNAGSKLKYPAVFEPKKREVYLEGEGFFEVSKDAKRPFIVHTSDINVRVLGTVFDVKSYPGEKTIETTLVSGSVEIEGNYTKGKKVPLIKLTSNQQATYFKDNKKITLKKDVKVQKEAQTPTNVKPQPEPKQENIIVAKHVHTELYTSWKNNSLIFDKEPLESIATKLERRYGAKIIFTNDSVKHYRFSGRFDEISIDQALNALNYASPFDYKIQNDTIYIGASNRKLKKEKPMKKTKRKK